MGVLPAEFGADIGDAPGEMGDALPPVDLGTSRTATAIAAGRETTCAVLDDGALKCWGSRFVGVAGQHNADGGMGDDHPGTDLGSARAAGCRPATD